MLSKWLVPRGKRSSPLIEPSRFEPGLWPIEKTQLLKDLQANLDDPHRVRMQPVEGAVAIAKLVKVSPNRYVNIVASVFNTGGATMPHKRINLHPWIPKLAPPHNTISSDVWMVSVLCTHGQIVVGAETALKKLTWDLLEDYRIAAMLEVSLLW